MKTIAEYKMGGISFFIPCNPNAECEFLKDVVPAEQTPEQLIEEAIQDISMLADSINEEAEQHDDWYNRMHDFDTLNHIPQTHK